MALKIPSGSHHWTRMSIYMQDKKQQESSRTCLKAREVEGFSKTLLNMPALLYASYFVSAFLWWGLSTVLAYPKISVVEFASGPPCNRTTPDCWSFPQKWAGSAEELPEPSCSLWCLAWFWGHAAGWSTREGCAEELELLQCLMGWGEVKYRLEAAKPASSPLSLSSMQASPPQQQRVCSLVQNWALVGSEISSPCVEHSNLLWLSRREPSRTPRTRLSEMAATSQYALKVISSSLCGSVRGPSWDLCYFL